MLKVAYVMGGFPAVSETFILHQLVGMARRGLEMEIHAVRPEPGAPVHALVEEFGLMRFVRYRPRHPRNPAALFAWTAWYFLRNLRHLSMMKEVFLRGRNNPYSRTFTYLSLAHSLLRSKADVVHAQFGHSGRVIAGIKQTGLVHQPLVTSFRGGDTTVGAEHNAVRYADLYRIGSRFLPVSRFIAHKHTDAGCPPDKIEIIHSGINLELFRFQEILGSSSRQRLLVVARLTEVKGVRYAIEAMVHLLPDHSHLQLTILGDGDLRSELESLAKSLNISSSVCFKGAVNSDAVRDAMQNSSVFIMPSIRAPDGAEEGLPNSLKEAMAIGIPVIATATGGIPELVENGVSGLLVPERDPAALANAVMRLINHPEQIGPMVRAAREKVEREFDIEKLNDRLVEIYREGVAANR
jgi:colanic acid/amylovoran biosynthesis glycosyltransferase